jgi:hypothetical protein
METVTSRHIFHGKFCDMFKMAEGGEGYINDNNEKLFANL